MSFLNRRSTDIVLTLVLHRRQNCLFNVQYCIPEPKVPEKASSQYPNSHSIAHLIRKRCLILVGLSNQPAERQICLTSNQFCIRVCCLNLICNFVKIYFIISVRIVVILHIACKYNVNLLYYFYIILKKYNVNVLFKFHIIRKNIL